ncbi:MAG: 5'-3' exonuclease H3TH domain-containing protein, partial [Acidimicrobiales bacterium]|nr:5'-3' exonuclease H3TH domain-containing protein [Acidimicrobiales bacterium]
RREVVYDWDGVIDKFGVPPPSIPDWLALVGDSADGIPGLSGWGPRSSAKVLSRYGHIELIPESHNDWDVKVRGAERLAGTLATRRNDALLYRRLATLDLNAPVMADVEELRWTGPLVHLVSMCKHLDAPRLVGRLEKLAETRN